MNESVEDILESIKRDMVTHEKLSENQEVCVQTVGYVYAIQAHVEKKIIKQLEALLDSTRKRRRNCDVGGAGEQEERHNRWCIRSAPGLCQGNCRECALQWGQMKYEEDE